MTHPEDRTNYVLQLTSWHTEKQPPTPHTRAHLVSVPPLLEQLAASDTPSRAAGSETAPGYESKPAARLEAIDALLEIADAARRHIVDLGHTPRHTTVRPSDPTRGLTAQERAAEVATLVLQLSGVVPEALLDRGRRAAAEQAERDVRHWWITARIVTGWDSPPWSPDNTCPQCGELRTLRVRLADQLALCTACQASWNAGTIGLLAEHIRTEAAEREAARGTAPGRSACWCPWPKPIVADLGQICPACGSARCHHAVAAREVEQLRRKLAAETAAS